MDLIGYAPQIMKELNHAKGKEESGTAHLALTSRTKAFQEAASVSVCRQSPMLVLTRSSRARVSTWAFAP